MDCSDVSIAFHIASIGLRGVGMVGVDRALVGVKTVRWMKSDPATPLLFVYLL